jgi:hypothetical protein
MNNHQQFNLTPFTKLPTDQGVGVAVGNILRIDKTLNIKNKFIVNDIEVSNKLGQGFKRTAFSTLLSGSVYSVSTNDFLIAVTSLSYAASVGLPSPSLVGEGKHYIIKDETGGAATTTITIRSVAEETIDGSATSTITTNYGSKEYYTDGNVWFTK